MKISFLLVMLLASGFANAGQAFEYKKSGLIIALELNDKGTALLVVNESKNMVSISPKDIKITTQTKVITPCTIHHISMFGIGSPLISVSVKPGEKEGFMLTACVPMGASIIVSNKVKTIKVGKYLIPKVDVFNKK